MNKADSERMASAIERLGLHGTEDASEADVLILNSCSVRQSAEQRILGKIGSIRHLKRRPNEPIIMLAGCMVGEDHDELKKRLPYVDAFVRPSDIDAVVEVVKRHMARKGDTGASAYDAARAQLYAEELPQAEVVTKGNGAGAIARWVPIQYGCNNFCSYCIVPYRRGRERSRPVDEIVAEVRGFVAEGAREVTLLGQNVDSYGRDLPGRPDLADLLAEIDEIEGLYRVRFLTSHPKDMTEHLMQAVASLPKVCEHINLPVQHGDDDMLRAMRRGYTAQRYRDLVARLRSYAPNVSLSTDVIVGFPGETEEQFQRAYDLIEELRFDVVHAAMYSPRPGTRAALLPDDVAFEEKKRRLDLIEQLQERVVAETNRGLVGTTVEILVEDLRKEKLQGRTRANKLVFAPGDERLCGQLVDVRVESATAWSLRGTLLGVKVLQ
jgi:tRNA-2-methylthio-N6-dimethylallyladenosine synthase